MRARNRPGFGWKRLSTVRLHEALGLFLDYRGPLRDQHLKARTLADRPHNPWRERGQESGVRETRSRRLMWRTLETGSRQPYTGTELETVDTAKGSLRGTAPVLNPTSISKDCVYFAMNAWRCSQAKKQRRCIPVSVYFHSGSASSAMKWVVPTRSSPAGRGSPPGPAGFRLLSSALGGGGSRIDSVRARC